MKHEKLWNEDVIQTRRVFLSIPLKDKNVLPEEVAKMMEQMKKDLKDIYGDKVELDFHYVDDELPYCDFAYFSADYEKYEECKHHFDLCMSHDVTAVIETGV